MSKFDRVGATRRAQRVRDGVSSISEVVSTLIEIQERQDWLALNYRSWTEYCEGEFGPTRLKLSAEQRGQVVAVLVASGMPKRRVATALGISEGTVRNDTKRRPSIQSAQNYAPAEAEPQVKAIDPITEAVTVAIEETADRVGSEWSCEHCNGKLTGPEWEGGRRRCISCDKGGHHRALTLDERLTSDNDFTTDCRECLRLARIAAETAAGAVTPVEPADAAVVVVGGSEPDVGGLGPEELGEEEAATPPGVTLSHPSDSPAAVTDDTASQVVLQQPGADAPIPLGAPDGGGVDLPPPSLSGITSETEGVPWETADVDHRPAATGVSPVGREAPERPPLSVEPVLEDGGPAPALPSSSSDPEDLPDELAPSAGRPETIVAAYRDFADLLDEVIDHDVLAPLITDAEMAELHALADRIAFHVGAIERWRTP